MYDEEYRFNVNTTWIANEESVSIKELICLEDFHNSAWMQLTEDEMVQLGGQLDEDENFSPLQIMRQNQNEPCSLSIVLEDPNMKISKLIVISGAKIIEFYGKHGEYISTQKGRLLGFIGGKEFHLAQSDTCGTEEITLKFCVNGANLWLYGITLLVVPASSSGTKHNCAAIDYANVDHILRNSNIHLTENAERAKQFIMNYNITRRDENLEGKQNEEILQNLLQKWNSLGNCKRESGDGDNTVETVKSLIAKLTTTSISSNAITNGYNSDNKTEIVTSEEKIDKDKDNLNDLRNYVDKKLQELEEKVQKNLQLQLKDFEQKQNEKLDKIIQLIGSK